MSVEIRPLISPFPRKHAVSLRLGRIGSTDSWTGHSLLIQEELLEEIRQREQMLQDDPQQRFVWCLVLLGRTGVGLAERRPVAQVGRPT